MKSILLLITVLGVQLVSAESNQHLFPSGVEVLRGENVGSFMTEPHIGEKEIFGYSPSNRGIGVSRMILKGRSPKNFNYFEYNTTLLLSLYVTKGTGYIHLVGQESIFFDQSDVIVIPPKTRFAIESATSTIEYIIFTSPKWYPEQATIVDESFRRVK